MSALDSAARVSRALPLPGALARSWFVVGRNITAFRRAWLLLLSGVAEPVSSLVRRATLEDVFLHLTGRTLVD